MQHPVIRAAALTLALPLGLSLAGAPALAQSPAEFYKGKEIKVLIGQPVGGGYDTYARWFARRLPEFMVGKPTVTVQNMPGAGGVIMTNSLVAQQPRDGSVIGAAAGSIATAPLFGMAAARFDSRELSWIGSLNSEVGLVISRKDSPIQTTKDIFEKEFITGGSGASDGNVIFPRAMNEVLGAKFKVIPGYGGTAKIAVAIESGEIHGTGSWHYSSIRAARPQWLDEGRINVLVQLALKPHPDISGVPTVIELARNDEERAILELIFAQQDMGRPLFGPPGVPADRLKALRDAFDAFVRDPGVKQEAAKMKIEVNNPMPGAEIEALVRRLHAMPQAAIKRASQAVRGGS